MKSKFLISLVVLVTFLLNTSNVKAQESYKPKLPKENNFEKIKIDLENNLNGKQCCNKF